MKLIKMLHRFNAQFLLKLPSDVYTKSLISFCAVAFVCALVWISGPSLAWNEVLPLAQPEKRLYIICSLLLLWLLKFLLIDLDIPNPTQHKDPGIQKKLRALQSRFYGAVSFMHKTSVTKQGKAMSLSQLPWYLLIGPASSGKSTLLANSNVNFILHKHRQMQNAKTLTSSEHCDWWMTRDVCIIDVPGKYLTTYESPTKNNPFLWQFFLDLIKKYRNKQGIEGIIITLPLPEIMKQADLKNYQGLLKNTFQRIHEIQSIYAQQNIPCHLIITKCDLLPGFTEFFNESASDETTQAWGVTLTKSKSGEKAYDVFAHRFDALIKKINQQLIYRLHHERNPMTRPYIKDFPLQIERTKEFIHDFIKKFTAANFSFSLQSVHLTSALQEEPEDENAVLDENTNTTQRAVQIFKEPLPTSRPYFIKQLIANGLSSVNERTIYQNAFNWKRNIAIAVSAVFVLGAAFIFGRDFQHGVQRTNAIKSNFVNYQLAIQQIQDPDGHLAKTAELLNTLQTKADNSNRKFDLSHILNFYSNKSQEKASATYQQALQVILLPEIKSYLGEYLKNPVNRNADSIYTILKAYLMLGDTSHFDVAYLSHTIYQYLPRSLGEQTINQLMGHVDTALKTAWTPLSLDIDLIQRARKFLTGMPNTQLGYIILKSMNDNLSLHEVNLGLNAEKNPVFTSQQHTNFIPTMFTASAFASIISQEIPQASEEATAGNWIIGNDFNINRDPLVINALTEQLRISYLSSYIALWETLLAGINITDPKDLAQTNKLIININSSDSPLLQLLQTIHDNTYFEPIISTSTKLSSLGILIENKGKQSDNLLYQIFTALQMVHQYIQPIISAQNEKKAAFEAVANRMTHQGTQDEITQLLLIADRSPEPIKSWLSNIANDVWRTLMQDAARYIDFSWQEQVGKVYENQIAHRYPFSGNMNKEVKLQSFVNFFGNPGVVMNFYNNYLHSFIDTTKSEWHWKTLDNKKLPFSEETLSHIQTAMQIHHTFFPNGDNKLSLQFTLQPHKFGKNIKSIKITLNDKQLTDTPKGKAPHFITWPNTNKPKLTSIKLMMNNQKVFNRNFSGDWGLFKLVNESYETISAKKSIVLNLAMNDQPAQYLLLTEKQFNPYLTLNLRNFQLPHELTENKA